MSQFLLQNIFDFVYVQIFHTNYFLCRFIINSLVFHFILNNPIIDESCRTETKELFLERECWFLRLLQSVSRIWVS